MLMDHVAVCRIIHAKRRRAESFETDGPSVGGDECEAMTLLFYGFSFLFLNEKSRS